MTSSCNRGRFDLDVTFSVELGELERIWSAVQLQWESVVIVTSVHGVTKQCICLYNTMKRNISCAICFTQQCIGLANILPAVKHVGSCENIFEVSDLMFS
jgi:hypothetical protein